MEQEDDDDFGTEAALASATSGSISHLSTTSSVDLENEVDEQHYQKLVVGVGAGATTTEDDPLPSLSWWGTLRNVLGVRFIVMMVLTQGLLRGVSGVIMAGLTLPLFQDVFQVEAGRMQIMMTSVYLAWAAKPLIGVMSDIMVINGRYRKKAWMWIGVVVGVFGSAFSFLAYAQSSPMGICICFMLVQSQIAIFDLMMESTWSALMQKKPKETGTIIVTFADGLQNGGSVLAAIAVGPMTDHGLYIPLIVVLLVLSLTPIYFVYHNWIGEEDLNYPRATSFWNLITFRFPPLRRERFMLGVVFITGTAALFIVFMTNVVDAAVGLGMALVILLWIMAATYLIFPRMMFRIALFQALVMLSRPSIGRALDYFYTTSCLGDRGPNFPFWFYTTVATVIGTLASLLGSALYQRYLKNITFRKVLIGTQLLSGATGASDLFLVTRANVALGIPDKAAYLCGEAIAEPLIYSLNNAPARTLLSKVVPKGLESSCYAFQAGIGNFAMMISEMSGALIFEAAGIRTGSSDCNFSALWWLVLVCHVSLPILGGVPASWLVPNIYPHEKIEQ